MPVELCAPRSSARFLPRMSDESLLGFGLLAWGMVMIVITLLIGANPVA
jgi:hypothetical protein